MRAFLLPLSVCLIASCSQAPLNNLKIISINQLLSDEVDAGVKIETTGYLQKDGASAVFNLFPYEADAINEDLSRAITVIPLGVVQNLDLGSCEKKYVSLRGTFYPKSKTNQRQIIPVQEIRLLKQGDNLTPNLPCWVNPKEI